MNDTPIDSQNKILDTLSEEFNMPASLAFFYGRKPS